MPKRPGRKISGQQINIWSTATAAAMAVAALVLSLITTVQLNSSPNVTVTMPNSIRLAAVSVPELKTHMSHDIYIQPSLTVDRFSNENPVITQYALSITSRSDGKPIDAYPISFSSFPADNSKLGEQIKHDSDILPLAVTPAGPVAPAIQFTIFDTYFPQGESTLHLTLKEASGEVVTNDTCLDLTKDSADQVNKNVGKVYSRLFKDYTGPTGAPDRDKLDPNCYSL